MPMQTSGAISMSQLRAEFRRSSSGSVSMSQLVKNIAFDPATSSTYTTAGVRNDAFVDPAGTIKTTASNMSMSNYYNTTYGQFYVRTAASHTPHEYIPLPLNINRMQLVMVGGGGAGAVRTINGTRRSQAGGGAGSFFGDNLRAADTFNLWDTTLGGREPLAEYIRHGAWVWISSVGSGGTPNTYQNSNSTAGDGGMTDVALLSDVISSKILYIRCTAGYGGQTTATISNSTGGGGGDAYVFYNRGQGYSGAYQVRSNGTSTDTIRNTGEYRDQFSGSSTPASWAWNGTIAESRVGGRIRQRNLVYAPYINNQMTVYGTVGDISDLAPSRALSVQPGQGGLAIMVDGSNASNSRNASFRGGEGYVVIRW